MASNYDVHLPPCTIEGKCLFYFRIYNQRDISYLSVLLYFKHNLLSSKYRQLLLLLLLLCGHRHLFVIKQCINHIIMVVVHLFVFSLSLYQFFVICTIHLFQHIYPTWVLLTHLNNIKI